MAGSRDRTLGFTNLLFIVVGTVSIGNDAGAVASIGAVDRATYDRPTELPTGIEWVIVNGVVTIDRGRHTGAKAGQVLRGAGQNATP